MAITKVLAREWVVQINTGTYGTPTWTNIGGLTSLTFSTSKNDADTTDFDSDGQMEHIPASRSREIGLEGFYEEDASTGDRDSGQEAVEGYMDLTGAAGLADFKLTSPGGTAKRFYASVNVSDVGGGNDDPTSWNVTLTVTGLPISA